MDLEGAKFLGVKIEVFVVKSSDLLLMMMTRMRIGSRALVVLLVGYRKWRKAGAVRWGEGQRVFARAFLEFYLTRG